MMQTLFGRRDPPKPDQNNEILETLIRLEAGLIRLNTKENTLLLDMAQVADLTTKLDKVDTDLQMLNSQVAAVVTALQASQTGITPEQLDPVAGRLDSVSVAVEAAAQNLQTAIQALHPTA